MRFEKRSYARAFAVQVGPHLAAARLWRLRRAWKPPSVTHSSLNGILLFTVTVKPATTKEKECHRYGRKNHLSAECRFKDAECQINGDSSQTMKVQLQINGTPLSMEIDTGAAVSIISEPTQRNLFPTATLQPARIKLRTYTLGSLCPCLAMEKLLWMSHINRTTTRFH